MARLTFRNQLTSLSTKFVAKACLFPTHSLGVA
jgi:hypothetical protein